MQTAGRIAGSSGVQLLSWEPNKVLDEIDLNEIRFSRGFLRANPVEWFPSMANHWVPLCHGLGVEIELLDVNTSLHFPETIDRIVPFEVDGEPAVIGLDELSQRTLVHAVSAECEGTAAELVIDYIERRILSTLRMSWAGKSPLVTQYISSSETKSVEVIGAVQVSLSISGVPCTFWFGLGSRVMERLDLVWRRTVCDQFESQESSDDEDLHVIGVDLAELAVPPALLIDYMRSGTVIDLEMPLSSEVTLQLDGQPWASGNLLQYNGKCAVRINDLLTTPNLSANSTTRVRVQIAYSELDREAIQEYSQPGAILLTKTPVSSTASMVISGENVAEAVVGQIDGQFAVNVLPK